MQPPIIINGKVQRQVKRTNLPLANRLPIRQPRAKMTPDRPRDLSRSKTPDPIRPAPLLEPDRRSLMVDSKVLEQKLADQQKASDQKVILTQNEAEKLQEHYEKLIHDAATKLAQLKPAPVARWALPKYPTSATPESRTGGGKFLRGMICIVTQVLTVSPRAMSPARNKSPLRIGNVFCVYCI